MSFDPATVAAFVDGELDDFNMRRIEREAATDAALAAEIARHRALKARLSAHYAPVLEAAVPERLRSLFTANAKTDTSPPHRRNPARPRFSGLHLGAIPASPILALTTGLPPWMPCSPAALAKHANA